MMAAYQVTHRVEAVLTVKADTKGAAFSTAHEELTRALVSLSADVTIENRETSVYEHPSGPFEPYRVAIEADATVTLDAPDEETATRRAKGRLEAALADLGPEVDEWSFAGDAAVAPAD